MKEKWTSRDRLRDRGRQRRRPADGRRRQHAAGPVPRRARRGAVRGRDEHDDGREPAARRSASTWSGAIRTRRPRSTTCCRTARTTTWRRRPTRRMLVTTSYNDSQVMYWEPAKYVAQAAHAQDRQQPAAAEDQDGARRPRRRVRPLRRAARPRLRVRLDAEPGRDHEVDRPEARSAPHARPGPGHHQLARDRLRRRRRAARRGPAGVHAALPRSRAGSSTTPRRSGRPSRRRRSRRSRGAGLRPGDIAAHRHHEPARDHGALGPQDGRAAPPRDRLAGPAHGAPSARSCSADGAEAHGARSAPASCSTRTSPAPSSRGCSTTCTARGARAERGELAFGTIDTLARLQAHGRPAARHRRDQRLAHAALQHPHAATGTTSCCGSCACRAACCPRCAASSEVYGDGRASPGSPASRSRASRATSRPRSSGRRASSPACQEHLRHRLLHAA